VSCFIVSMQPFFSRLSFFGVLQMDLFSLPCLRSVDIWGQLLSSGSANELFPHVKAGSLIKASFLTQWSCVSMPFLLFNSAGFFSILGVKRKTHGWLALGVDPPMKRPVLERMTLSLLLSFGVHSVLHLLGYFLFLRETVLEKVKLSNPITP